MFKIYLECIHFFYLYHHQPISYSLPSTFTAVSSWVCFHVGSVPSPMPLLFPQENQNSPPKMLMGWKPKSFPWLQGPVRTVPCSFFPVTLRLPAVLRSVSPQSLSCCSANWNALLFLRFHFLTDFPSPLPYSKSGHNGYFCLFAWNGFYLTSLLCQSCIITIPGFITQSSLLLCIFEIYQNKQF